MVMVTDGAARVRSPIVAMRVPIARVIVVVAVVVVIVMHMNTGAAIPIVMPIIMAMIRMTVIAVMIDVQAVSEPANSKRCGYAPKETMRK